MQVPRDSCERFSFATLPPFAVLLRIAENQHPLQQQENSQYRVLVENVKISREWRFLRLAVEKSGILKE